MVFQSKVSTTENQKLYVETVTGLVLFLPPTARSEQAGVICAFYISIAEEAVSRWLYLFQSHLFMQEEDRVASL